MWLCEGKPYVLGGWWRGLCGPFTFVSCAHQEAAPEGSFRVVGLQEAWSFKLGDSPGRKAQEWPSWEQDSACASALWGSFWGVSV